jgi:hypothetical protein
MGENRNGWAANHMIWFEETCWLRLQNRNMYYLICEHTLELLRVPLLSKEHKLQGSVKIQQRVGWTKGPESESSKLWGLL